MTLWAQTPVVWCERVIQTLIAYPVYLFPQATRCSVFRTAPRAIISPFCFADEHRVPLYIISVGILIWGGLKATFNTPKNTPVKLCVRYLYLKSLTDVNYLSGKRDLDQPLKCCRTSYERQTKGPIKSQKWNATAIMILICCIGWTQNSDMLFIPKGYNVRIKVSNWTEWHSPAVYLD